MQAQSAHCGYTGNKGKGWNKETETGKTASTLWGQGFVKFNS